VLPNTLLIGAMRAGTTTLWAYLRQHPEIASGSAKERDYLSWDFHKPIDWYRSTYPLARRALGTRFLDASPSYLIHPRAAERAACLVPDARILVVVRHPVQRAYSHYNFVRLRGWEELSFADALACEEERMSRALAAVQAGNQESERLYTRFAYKARSRYAEQLRTWWSHFPKDRVHVVCSEELYANPQRVVSDAFEFLRVDPSFVIVPEHRNARPYDEPLDESLRRSLGAHFAASVAELETEMGRSFGWQL
jgi:hypothetical protein